MDPIPSSHFRLEQATLSQLVLVKRELRRVGLLQLLRSEEATLLKGLIKSMRERHATLRKRLASAAQQKSVGMLSDALAQCERYHVDFEDELEDAVVLCANLSADAASGEGIEDRGITKCARALQYRTCIYLFLKSARFEGIAAMASGKHAHLVTVFPIFRFVCPAGIFTSTLQVPVVRQVENPLRENCHSPVLRTVAMVGLTSSRIPRHRGGESPTRTSVWILSSLIM